jgi:opacity protein-like surface antigen
MRRFILALSVVSGILLFTTSAAAQTRGGQIEGFGGTTFGTSASAPTFGGSVAVPLGDHVQLLGEAGRLTDIKASLLDEALDLSPLDIGMSAWYAEGGVRFIGSPRSAVRPYVEVSAGVARLKPSVGAEGWLGAVTNTGLAFLSSTEPVVGAGGGVMIQGGPVVVDLGYRYKRILADGGLATAFALGNDGFDVNQVRVGLGIRF